jgi:hypothetical protein
LRVLGVFACFGCFWVFLGVLGVFDCFWGHRNPKLKSESRF